MEFLEIYVKKPLFERKEPICRYKNVSLLISFMRYVGEYSFVIRVTDGGYVSERL